MQSPFKLLAVLPINASSGTGLGESRPESGTVVPRKTSSTAWPCRGRARSGGPVAGILATLCLLDVPVVRAADGTPPFAWETVAGHTVGLLIALAALLVVLRIRHLTRRRTGQRLYQYELLKRMRGDPDPETLATAVLEYVGETCGASVGVLYLARPDESLEPAATFGLAPEAAPPRAVPVGEGIVGRAAERRRVVVLDQVDERHLDLATGLGRSAPRSVIVAPFHAADRITGVLELAVAGPVAGTSLEFLRSSAESVAMALDSALARARVQRLLKETRRQAEVLAGQRRQLQQQNTELERANRYQNEFLANMSHELRTPLNSMLIMSQVLAENRVGNLSDVQVDNALTINKAGNELLLIINDILDMSRVEAGRLEVHPETTDLGQVLRGLEDLFRPVAARQGLTLSTVCEPGVPHTAVTDPLRVSQILKNLLSNAFKFTAEGGVELRLRAVDAAEVQDRPGRAADWAAVTVSDTGIGMDAETADQVFGVFRQGDGSIARRYGGSGLGLSISRSLAELLGGQISVSSSEGRGSCFTLLVPRGMAAAGNDTPVPARETEADAGTVPAVAGSVAPPGESPLLERHVLLADTDMRTVYELSSLLDGMGAEVEVVRSAAAATRRLATGGPWDLLVVDATLAAEPDSPGELADDLRTIILHGPQADPAVEPGRPHLAKPVVRAAFLRLCRELFDGASPAAAAVTDRPEAGVPA